MSEIKNKWEFYGENDPYFAVSTFEKYKVENINDEIKQEFFQTGEDHFVKVWETIDKHFLKDFKPLQALDFGCGVGRLVIPLSTRCENVTGIDISEKMLSEAKHNSEQRKITNIEFYQTDEFFRTVEKKFDFIHSFIVFQHIDPDIGEEFAEKFIKLLNVGGIGVLHFTYFNEGSRFNWAKFKIYSNFPLINRLKNLVKGEKQEPFIPMYLYNLNKVLTILQKNNCHKVLVKFSDHGLYGAVLFFQKEGEIEY